MQLKWVQFIIHNLYDNQLIKKQKQKTSKHWFNSQLMVLNF